MKLYKKIIYKGQLELLTGLHIGDSKETTDIGGVDSPVVRRKDNNEPYIPGSSIKGKIRSLLDIAHGKSDTSRDGNHIIGKLFGNISKDAGVLPSRLIVRDAYLSRNSANKINESSFTDMPFTEVKFENTINRLNGIANPRQIERVPAGAEFEVEFVINIIADSESEAATNEKSFIELFNAGIKLLEDDYLGGSGSRGYGQVKLNFSDPIVKTVETYLNGIQ